MDGNRTVEFKQLSVPYPSFISRLAHYLLGGRVQDVIYYGDYDISFNLLVNIHFIKTLLLTLP